MACPSLMLSIYFRPQCEEMLPPTAFLFVCERGSQRLMDTTRTAHAGPAVATASLFSLGSEIPGQTAPPGRQRAGWAVDGDVPFVPGLRGHPAGWLHAPSSRRPSVADRLLGQALAAAAAAAGERTCPGQDQGAGLRSHGGPRSGLGSGIVCFH